MNERVLYVVSCAAPPVLRVETLIDLAQGAGWDTCLILTPAAARWREKDLFSLSQRTGHPVRSQYKLPREPDVLPPAGAMLVCPATANTINKWALGISDTLALGLITEAIGRRLPLAALPCCNAAQARHPAFGTSVSVLRSAGVTVLLGAGGFVPREPGQGGGEEFPWQAGLDALVNDAVPNDGGPNDAVPNGFPAPPADGVWDARPGEQQWGTPWGT